MVRFGERMLHGLYLVALIGLQFHRAPGGSTARSDPLAIHIAPAGYLYHSVTSPVATYKNCLKDHIRMRVCHILGIVWAARETAVFTEFGLEPMRQVIYYPIGRNLGL